MTTAYDKSIVSNIEGYLVTKLGAITEIPTGNVDILAGVRDLEGMEDVNEFLMAERTPRVLVSWQGFTRAGRGEGQRDRIERFSIWVCVKNVRPGKARVGESATDVGTNRIVEEIDAAIDDDTSTDVDSSDNFAIGQVNVESGNVIYRPGGVNIVEMTVTIRTVPV